MENDRIEIEKSLVKEISTPIFNNRNWIKFLGVLMLVYGIFLVFSIIGIFIAWLPIWIGVLLIQSSSRIEQAKALGNKTALIKTLNNLSTYFTIYGIFALIGIIVGMILTIVILATGILTDIYDFLNNY